MIETSHKQIIWDSIVCLIVDDDKFSRTFVKTALYQIGIKNTKEAGNTEEAAELLHNFKIRRDSSRPADAQPKRFGIRPRIKIRQNRRCQKHPHYHDYG